MFHPASFQIEGVPTMSRKSFFMLSLLLALALGLVAACDREGPTTPASPDLNLDSIGSGMALKETPINPDNPGGGGSGDPIPTSDPDLVTTQSVLAAYEAQGINFATIDLDIDRSGGYFTITPPEYLNPLKFYVFANSEYPVSNDVSKVTLTIYYPEKPVSEPTIPQDATIFLIRNFPHGGYVYVDFPQAPWYAPGNLGLVAKAVSFSVPTPEGLSIELPPTSDRTCTWTAAFPMSSMFFHPTYKSLSANPGGWLDGWTLDGAEDDDDDEEP